MRVASPLTVPDDDADVLRTWIDGPTAGEAAARRARIVLLSGAGLGPTAISDELACSKQTVITWRERYREAGITGLRDASRPGRPSTVCARTVVRRMLEAPPAGTRRWTTRTLGAELGVSNASVGHVWRAWGVTPRGPGQVWLSTEPVLDAWSATITGIHLGPSVRVLAVRSGEPGPEGPEPGGPDLDALLGPAATGPDEGIEDFVRRVGPAAPLLIADGVVDTPGPVHVVPPDQSWARIVQVLCWIAGRTAPGSASVAALHAALAARTPDSALSWTRL